MYLLTPPITEKHQANDERIRYYSVITPLPMHHSLQCHIACAQTSLSTTRNRSLRMWLRESSTERFRLRNRNRKLPNSKHPSIVQTIRTSYTAYKVERYRIGKVPAVGGRCPLVDISMTGHSRGSSTLHLASAWARGGTIHSVQFICIAPIPEPARCDGNGDGDGRSSVVRKFIISGHGRPHEND